MCKCKRKFIVKVTNKEVKGSINELEENKILKCSRKNHVDIINEEMKGSISEEEEIGIRKCRKRSRVVIVNEEVKGWTSSSQKQEAPPEPTMTKYYIRLEQMKIKVEVAALESNDFLL